LVQAFRPTLLLVEAFRPTLLGSNEDQVPWFWRRTHVSWVLHPYPLDHVFSWVSRLSPILFSQSSVPNSFKSCLQTKISWVWTILLGYAPYSFLLNLAFGSISIESCVWAQISWVIHPDQNLLDQVFKSNSLGSCIRTSQN